MKNRIAEFRKAKGLTQKQLAEALGMTTYQSLQQYENGRFVPNVYTAILIAKALDTTVEELFPLEEFLNG